MAKKPGKKKTVPRKHRAKARVRYRSEQPMRDEEYFIERTYSKSGQSRFTQDSPILADVFVHYGLRADKNLPLDLLLTPDWSKTPGEVAHELRAWLGTEEMDQNKIAYNQSVVAVQLTFEELFIHVLPMSWWWQNRMVTSKEIDIIGAFKSKRLGLVLRHELIEALTDSIELDKARKKTRWVAQQYLDSEPVVTRTQFSKKYRLTLPDLAWAAHLFWVVQHSNRDQEPDAPDDEAEPIADYFLALLEKIAVLQETRLTESDKTPPETPWVFSVNRNRPLEATVFDSIKTTKVDAAINTFGVTGRHITWAVIDTGIDARHPAFRATKANGERYALPFDGESNTRIKATYDFSNIRETLSQRQRTSLTMGRLLDWEAIEQDKKSKLRVPHTESGYRAPVDPHGTHVAGILASDWQIESGDPLGPTPSAAARQAPLKGMCTEIELYDLRVFKEDGTGDEFAVMSALQFVRSLNQRHDTLEVHGVNLSLAMHHEVSNYACGRTPVCEECTRLVGNGVVVVAAAGNDGRSIYLTPQHTEQEGYRAISIADPGNADSVITVGSTHRRDAHTYGVSYFSSRGPTGDGRSKPDLVAPGEKILSTIPDEQMARADGTSQAAPHVSAAAALLMSRHWELVGQPDKVKSILMNTATDLGRERHYQGAGLVDVLRAIQSV